MTQQKRNSLKRRKALFGELAVAGAIAAQTAAQSGMAAMQAAATRESAALQAQSTVKAAQQNANATINSAKVQAKATQEVAKMQKETSDKTNEINRELAQQSQDFTKSENEAARDLQQQMQMNLQLAMGQENSKQRREAARITVRNGCNVRKRLKGGGIYQYPPTGELGFRITDGDKGLSNPIIPIQSTPDGGIIYMVHPSLANHGESNGDGKKGVGFATKEGNKIPKNSNLELEGGEIFKAIPGQGVVSVVSKHTLPNTNFDPKDYYLVTGDYDRAFAIQEGIKNAKDIPDGYAPSNRKHKLNGGMLPQSLVNLETIYNQQPNLNTDTINGTIATVIATQNDNTGKGYNFADGQLNQEDTSRTNAAQAKYGKNVRHSLKSRKQCRWGNLNYGQQNAILTGIGTGTSALSTVIGGLIGASAARDAAEAMAGAYATEKLWNDAAANISSMYAIQGIKDASNAMKEAGQRIYDTQIEGMSKEDTDRYGFALPALQTSRVSTTAPIEKIDRAARRLSKINRRNSLSSAAAQQRDLEIETRAQEARADIYNKAAEQSLDIRNKNAEIINRVQNENLNRQLMAQREYMNNKLQVDAFNAANRIKGIEMMGEADSDRALGIAGTQSNRINTLAGNASRQLLGSASVNASAAESIGNIWGSVLGNLGNSVSQGLNTAVNYMQSFKSDYAKASPEQKAEMANLSQAKQLYAVYKGKRTKEATTAVKTLLKRFGQQALES